MAKQSIDIGTTAGDNTGTTLREGAPAVSIVFLDIPGILLFMKKS